MPRILLAVMALTMAAFPALAQHAGHGGHSAPYAGMDARLIKALSDADLEELRRGGGWGLALAAELNGMPGPAHLLELKEPLGLSPDQVAQIERLFATMKADAVAVGARLIAAEEALEAAFRKGGVPEAELRALVDAAGQARSDLRFVHLSQHLATPPLLTAGQIAEYNRLRGYGANPCAAVPEGHNAAMWRKHNACE
jgi:Spy/CpxP family protein refolding chaperone